MDSPVAAVLPRQLLENESRARSKNLRSEKTFNLLAELLLSESAEPAGDDQRISAALQSVSSRSPEQMHDLLLQAESQRVLRRILAALKSHFSEQPRGALAEVLNQKLASEHQRVENALGRLQEIIWRFEKQGLPILVMKTLDHWPDTGSDLDLLVAAEEADVRRIFRVDFQATQQPPSWGDRLAHKLNFRLPQLKELVEVHIGCLGQTGEHRPLAAAVLARRIRRRYGAFSIPVPTHEDQVAIATLQRMYRHYYIRLTEIVNIHGLLSADRVDFDWLRAISEEASIWPGVATLIAVICQYSAAFGANPVTLPGHVHSAARFHANRIYLDRKFLRVPLIPEASGLFLRQITDTFRRSSFGPVARLSLLPVLATAAYLSFRITGSDKGIW